MRNKKGEWHQSKDVSHVNWVDWREKQKVTFIHMQHMITCSYTTSLYDGLSFLQIHLVYVWVLMAGVCRWQETLCPLVCCELDSYSSFLIGLSWPSHGVCNRKMEGYTLFIRHFLFSRLCWMSINVQGCSVLKQQQCSGSIQKSLWGCAKKDI